MITQEIIDAAKASLEDDSLHKTYRRAIRKEHWSLELLEKIYIAMDDQVKFYGRKSAKGYLSFDDACTIADKGIFSVVAIYEQYIETLVAERLQNAKAA